MIDEKIEGDESVWYGRKEVLYRCGEEPEYIAIIDGRLCVIADTAALNTVLRGDPKIGSIVIYSRH